MVGSVCETLPKEKKNTLVCSGCKEPVGQNQDFLLIGGNAADWEGQIWGSCFGCSKMIETLAKKVHLSVVPARSARPEKGVATKRPSTLRPEKGVLFHSSLRLAPWGRREDPTVLRWVLLYKVVSVSFPTLRRNLTRYTPSYTQMIERDFKKMSKKRWTARGMFLKGRAGTVRALDF
jgi:hypothetical protein